MTRPSVPVESAVEAAALARDPHPGPHPDERILPIVVDSFPALGKLTALRFLEWAADHPEGVVALPTGKTPEHFIRWVRRFRADWDRPDVRRLAEDAGFPHPRPPELHGLRFVQIDDFYPLDPTRENSFHHYVHRFYLTPDFGLDPARATLIDNRTLGLLPGQTLESVWPDDTVDLSLRYRAPRSHLEELQQATLHRIDQACQEYEDRVRALGGLGFFLGGIGPDGHIGFNVLGADHYSITRLAPTNYATQAAAAGDLGGIESARTRHVVTIGLATITQRPDAVAIIMAAGEAKARVVADAVLRAPDVRYPATALQKLPLARFYLTPGAASLLPDRRRAALVHAPALAPVDRDRVITDVSLRAGKPLLDLTLDDFRRDPDIGVLAAFHPENEWTGLARDLHKEYARRIEIGSTARRDTRFLHTEPHHDDIMLGYLTSVIRNTRDKSNQHWFATLTSGFTSVTNDFLRDQIRQARAWMDTDAYAELAGHGYFDDAPRHRDRDVWQYLDGVAADDPEMRAEGEARRMIRDAAALAGDVASGAVAACLDAALAYLDTAYPGRKDPEDIQQLKGMRREWEAECLWGYLGWSTDRIRHVRLGFYTGDIFTPEPTVARDVPPVDALLRETGPDVVTVAFDPEGAGPDTHYKTLQTMAAALDAHVTRGAAAPEIWGYRNVWYRFHPADANRWTPVSLNMLATMEKAFLSVFASQRGASFPSYELDGPFCDLARKIQVEQYQMAKTLLGRRWFQEHPSPLIRAARAFTFTRSMALDEFLGHARRLHDAVEPVR